MTHERRVVRVQVEQVDARCAALASEQWNVLDVHDLRTCGLSDDAIHTRARSGRLHLKYRGVYALVPKLSVEGLFLAAVKACGPDAVLSHFSAAVLRGWFRWDDRFPQVTTPKPRRHRGIRTHRSDTIERTVVNGIPVTPPARTVIDLSSTLPFLGLRRAVNEALNQRAIKLSDLVTGNHRGARNLRQILATAAPTKNEFEDFVLAVLRDLPTPDVNRPFLTYKPDFRWPEHKLILEADGAGTHDQPLARADDAHRQAILEAHGETVLRVTWHEATTRPQHLVTRVKAALGVL